MPKPENTPVPEDQIADPTTMNRRAFFKTGADIAGGTAMALTLTDLNEVLAGSKREKQTRIDMERNARLKEEIAKHIDTKHVQWLPTAEMLERHRLDCIDGRCTDCVAGTPGGDMGNLFLKLVAVERATGQKLDTRNATDIFDRYLAHRKGSFYMHTDEHHLEALALSMGIDTKKDPHWKHAIEGMVRNPGSKDQEKLLTALTNEKNVGCGHLKLMLGNAAEYPGDRPELLKALIRAFFDRKWNVGGDDKMEYVVLEGNHAEKAVLRVVSDTPLSKEALIPLITPCLKKEGEHGDGHQVFVVYPDLEKASEERFAEIAGEITGIEGIDAESLRTTMRELRGQYLAASAEKLVTKGQPMVTARFNQRGEITIAV